MGEIKPVYLLAGGRSANRRADDLLIRGAFRESGKKSPSVGYVGTASNDDRDFFDFFADLFRKNGAGKVSHALLAADNADIFRAKQILNHSDIIFIGGGDVYAGIQKIKEREMVDFLAGLYQEGKLFFGLSAGSIMLAEAWVRWLNPDDDRTAEIFACMKLAPVLCDTHDEKDGWNELKMLLMLEKEGAAGYGIVTGSALRVFRDGRMDALGGAVHRYVRQGGRVERMADVLPALMMGEKAAR